MAVATVILRLGSLDLGYTFPNMCSHSSNHNRASSQSIHVPKAESLFHLKLSVNIVTCGSLKLRSQPPRL